MSFFVIDRIKSRLHRDIVADPVLHGAILNLYLNGEAYPHRVDDYFPVGYVSEPELAAQMTRHAQEEDKHIALYRKAINRLGQEVVELPLSCIFNAVIRNHTEASFAIAAMPALFGGPLVAGLFIMADYHKYEQQQHVHS